MEMEMPMNSQDLNEKIFNSYDHFLDLIYEKYERIYAKNGFVFRDFIASIRQDIMNHGTEADIHDFISFQNQASRLTPADFFDFIVEKMHEQSFIPKNWHSQSEPLYSQVTDRLEELQQAISTPYQR